VGWVKAPHGIRGEVFIQLSAGRADWLNSLDKFFLIRIGEAGRDWPVKSARPHKDGLIVVLEGVETRNQSEELKRAQVYIPETWLQGQPGESIFLNEILNFTVIDNGVAVGVITGFASNGPQDLLRITRDGGAEALVPFVEDFIVRLDFENRKVEMNLPPGLLDIEEQ
jgi:16S rRNA processing protein RimM